MHPFHDYLACQLSEKLADRRVVCFYDPREEFAPFIDELQEIDALGELGADLLARQLMDGVIGNIARGRYAVLGIAPTIPSTVKCRADGVGARRGLGQRGPNSG